MRTINLLTLSTLALVFIGAWAQTERTASEFLQQNEAGHLPPLAARGTGVGNGGQGEEKAARVVIADGLKIALLSQEKSPIERVKAWSMNLKFLVEKASEDSKNALEKKGPFFAQNLLFDSLLGINDSLIHYPSISGAHTPRLVKRLVNLWSRMDERQKEIVARQKAQNQGAGSVDGAERIYLAKYRVLRKMLRLIVNIERNFDQKYIIHQGNLKASDEFLKGLEKEFAQVVYREYAFISQAMTTTTDDGHIGNEVPYSFFLNFTELELSDIEEDLSTNLYGYSNGDAVLRLDDLKKKLLAFNLQGDRNTWDDPNEAFTKTVEKLKTIQDKYLSNNATPDDDGLDNVDDSKGEKP